MKSYLFKKCSIIIAALTLFTVNLVLYSCASSSIFAPVDDSENLETGEISGISKKNRKDISVEYESFYYKNEEARFYLGLTESEFYTVFPKVYTKYNSDVKKIDGLLSKITLISITQLKQQYPLFYNNIWLNDFFNAATAEIKELKEDYETDFGFIIIPNTGFSFIVKFDYKIKELFLSILYYNTPKSIITELPEWDTITIILDEIEDYLKQKEESNKKVFEPISRKSTTKDGYAIELYQIDIRNSPDSFEYYVKLKSTKTNECFIWCFHNLKPAIRYFYELESRSVITTINIYGMDIAEDSRLDLRKNSFEVERKSEELLYWLRDDNLREIDKKQTKNFSTLINEYINISNINNYHFKNEENKFETIQL